MQRTFNYTNRHKIEQKQALFSFRKENGQAPEFNVVFDIDATNYPENASLYVEAYHKETRQRFDFGSVSQIRPPSNRKVDAIDLSGPTLFRVLIVDESASHGQLLASGDQFRADISEEEENRSSILAVRKYPLGQQTWKVYFEPGAAPELHLNNLIDDAIERMRTDPLFQSLILPAALREILMYYLWNEEETDGNDHCERWMAFANLFADNCPESDDPNELIDWIDEVVAGFSQRFHLADMLSSVCEGNE